MKKSTLLKGAMAAFALCAATSSLQAAEVDTLVLTGKEYYAFDNAEEDYMIKYAGASIVEDRETGNNYLEVVYNEAPTTENHLIAQGNPEIEGAAFNVSTDYHQTTAYTVSAKMKMVSDSMATNIKINLKDNYPVIPDDADSTKLWSYEMGVTFFLETWKAIQAPGEWVEISKNTTGDQGVRANLTGSTLLIQACTEAWTHPQACEFHMDDLALTLVAEGLAGAEEVVIPTTQVTAVAGAIVVESAAAQTINVYSLTGANVAAVAVAAGETATIPVAQGIYIVNNTKVVVK